MYLNLLNTRVIVNLLCISASVMLLPACSEKVEDSSEVIRPVRFQYVSNASSDRNVNFTGVVNADTETEFSFRVNGILVKLNVVAGKRVKKGDLIAALDDSDVKLKMDKQLLALDKSKAQLENASSNLNRIKGLYENNNVALGEYESAKEKHSNAKASYETEQRAVDLIKRELSYYKLFSPVDGVVLVSQLSTNENIQAGQLITTIQTGDGLIVEVGVADQYVTQTKVGQSANISFSSIAKKVFIGKVTEVAYGVNPDTSTYLVKVKIINPDKSIRPGMPGNVSFNFKSKISLSGLVIPVHAAVKDNAGNYVFVVIDNNDGFGTVRKKIIKLGAINNQGFEVLDGLVSGDKVITAGISSLADGMKVRLLK